MTVRRPNARRIRFSVLGSSHAELLAFVNDVNEFPRLRTRSQIPVWKLFGEDGAGEVFTGNTAGIGTVLTVRQERIRRMHLLALEKVAARQRRFASLSPWRRRIVQFRPYLLQAGLLAFVLWVLPLVLGLFLFQFVHYARCPFVNV